MFITTEEQIRIIDKWNTEEKSTRDLLCFYEGMEAVWKLIAEKDKAEKKQQVIFEIKGTKLKGVQKILKDESAK
jgi:hypothetical protein